MSNPPPVPRRLADILDSTAALPPGADRPLPHYHEAINRTWELLGHLAQSLTLVPPPRAQSAEEFLGHFHAMALVHLTEALERFFKEAAAACVDYLARYAPDERFNALRVQGSAVVAYSAGGSVGRAVCESQTWLDCVEINTRFRQLLAMPFAPGSWYLLPPQPSDPEFWRFESLSLVWQLRHTVVHNVGVVTRSDAVRLRLLAKRLVQGDRVLRPSAADLIAMKTFLDDTAAWCNVRVGAQLAFVLTALHDRDPTLFVPQDVADSVSATFNAPLTVAGVLGRVPQSP